MYMQVDVKYTGHMVHVDELKKVIENQASRSEILNSLDIIFRQGVLLRPELILHIYIIIQCMQKAEL